MGFDLRLDYPYKLRMYKVASGSNGAGNIEYLCETDQLTALTSQAVWRIRKFTYDNTGFQTGAYWADGVKSFTKEPDERTGYTFS